jgi:hypothetical protein
MKLKSDYIRQAKDYFAAGAAVPWWLSGVSLWMASFSATFFVISAIRTSPPSASSAAD